MLSEREEFLVSQLADGSIDAVERAEADALVARSEAARSVLASYRRLDVALRRDLPSPAADVDAIASSVRSMIELEESLARDADAQAARERLRIRPEPARWRRYAAAAGIAVAAGALYVTLVPTQRQSQPAPSVAAHAGTPSISIVGPAQIIASMAVGHPVSGGSGVEEIRVTLDALPDMDPGHVAIFVGPTPSPNHVLISAPAGGESRGAREDPFRIE